ncbi:YdiY family protein [Planctomycetota bacterium]
MRCKMDFLLCNKKKLIDKPMPRQKSFFQLSERAVRFQLLVIVAIWFLASNCSPADKVFLIDGDIIEGVITKQGGATIVLQHSDLGRMEIPKSRIKSLLIDTPDVEVVLTDGDTIQGRLVKEDGSSIVIEHKDLGQITIPRDRIASSKIEASDATVVLAGGDKIEGKLIERTDLAIVLKHPNLGRLEIPRERIDSLKIKEPEFTKEEKAGLLEPMLRKLSAKTSRLREKGWKSSVDISMDSSTGNTDEQSMRLGGHLKREVPDTRNTLDTSYYRKVKGNEITDNKLTLGYIHDWLDPESVWFKFAYGRFDYDEFESWRERGSLLVGPGYHLINSDEIKLDARLGFGPRKEWDSQNDDLKFEGAIGGSFEWTISKKEKLKFASYFFPTFGDLDDYRGRVSGEWRFLFDKDLNLNFLVGTFYEYQSIVDPDKAHGDMRTYVGLRFQF